MADQKQVELLGGTMRLGSYPCELRKNSLAHRIYKKTTIHERHRHRYEFNSAYKSQYEQAGMVFSGINPETELVEMIELPEHSFFVAAQFHPEYKSTVVNPHPLFVAFVAAAKVRKSSTET
jgi:CTP synthase